MLQIKHPNINNIAIWWATKLKSFLFDPITDKRKKPYVATKNKKSPRKYFDTYFEKYEHLYRAKCRNKIYKGIPFSERNKLWVKIKDFLLEEKNRIGEKDTLDNYVTNLSTDKVLISLKNVVEYVFVEIYTDFTKTHAHDLLKNLNIRCCPYCNRNYTFAVEKGSKDDFTTRPEFDHFYNKSDFPMLAVSFFNLIPSCPICNHGKGVRAASINPYFENLKAKFVIGKPADDKTKLEDVEKMNINEAKKISNESDFSISFEWEDERNKDKEKININTFGLRPLYNEHKDYVLEIVEKANAYDELTREGIVDRFQGVFHNEVDVYNLIFGKYLSDAEQPKRPLSKLTADILHQLDIRHDPSVCIIKVGENE